MKNKILISLVLSFVLILPCISYAQGKRNKYADDPIYNSHPPPKESTYMQDSIYERKIVEYKSDSIIIKHGHTYTMNGKEISDHDIRLRLLMGRTSAPEYEKSKKNRGGLILLITSPIVALSGIYTYSVIRQIGFGNNIPALFFASAGVAIIGVPIGISMLISQHHYYKKAIRLYNEEILKRHH